MGADGQGARPAGRLSAIFRAFQGDCVNHLSVGNYRLFWTPQWEVVMRKGVLTAAGLALLAAIFLAPAPAAAAPIAPAALNGASERSIRPTRSGAAATAAAVATATTGHIIGRTTGAAATAAAAATVRTIDRITRAAATAAAAATARTIDRITRAAATAAAATVRTGVAATVTAITARGRATGTSGALKTRSARPFVSAAPDVCISRPLRFRRRSPRPLRRCARPKPPSRHRRC